MSKGGDLGNAFIQGYACCIAAIIKGHGISTEVEEAFKNGIGTIDKCISAGVDEYDLEILKQHFTNDERGTNKG